MSLLQIQIDDKLKLAIQESAEKYGVPSSSLVRIALVKAFIDDEPWVEGNVFNAERDNEGKGLPIDEFLNMLRA